MYKISSWKKKKNIANVKKFKMGSLYGGGGGGGAVCTYACPEKCKKGIFSENGHKGLKYLFLFVFLRKKLFYT